MSVIPPDVSLSHGVEVVLATAQGSIIVCDEAKAQDQVGPRIFINVAIKKFF
jgi:hypothetical protein